MPTTVPRPEPVPVLDAPERFAGVLDRSPRGDDEAGTRRGPPSCFPDLHLDEVVRAVTRGREEYGLEAFFHRPLRDADAARYRQDVFADLEDAAVRGAVTELAARVRSARLRAGAAAGLAFRYERERWFVDAADLYVSSVGACLGALAGQPLKSEGLRSFRDYLAGYVESDGFRALTRDTRGVLEALDGVRYSVHVRGHRVRIGAGDPAGGDDTDYGAEIEAAFARFRRDAAGDGRLGIRRWSYVNLVEGRILDRLAKLFPAAFGLLDGYADRHPGFLDPVVARFEREIQLYLGYLDHLAPMRAAGLHFCLPELADGPGDVFAEDVFDLVLAARLTHEGSTVVANDLRLAGAERVLVVSGPNQGGKTTFARLFGQIHYLASLGFPVPGRRARLVLVDGVLTHFGHREDLASMHGKLDEELVHVREILARATDRSVIVMNESFSSTTVADARFLGTEILHRIIALGACAVYVTFVEELASLDRATVSMVATVAPDDPATRTYRLERRRADGRAYATSLAAKYGLTYEQLRRRPDR